jgi:hypothetical protein
MSEDDEPAATLKKGGGRGRGGGFVYVFKQQFAKPFEKTLKITMKSFFLSVFPSTDSRGRLSLLRKSKNFGCQYVNRT